MFDCDLIFDLWTFFSSYLTPLPGTVLIIRRDVYTNRAINMLVQYFEFDFNLKFITVTYLITAIGSGRGLMDMVPTVLRALAVYYV